MATFTRLEVWSDVACNSGTRLGILDRQFLLSCQATFSLDGNESLSFGVPAQIPVAADLTRGRVVRVCTADPAVFDEWRIRDIEQNAQAGTVGVLCDSIGLDLARALYTDHDGTGAPVSEFSAVQIDAEGLVDGPIRDALDDAGLTYIVKGTIEPTGTFDADADWASARTLALQAVERGGGELRVRRNGTTDYRLDILDEIGSTAPTVYARTARNLLTTQRRTLGGLGGTRVVARGKDDSTSRTMAYAYWEVTGLVTGLAGSRTGVVIRDPRGAGFPPPYGTGANRCDGWYLSRLVPTYAGAEVLASSAVSATETRLDLLATDVTTLGVTVGDLIELRLVNAVDGARPAALPDPTLIAAQAGIHDRVYDRTTLSGAVNYAPNPFLLDWSGQIDFRIAGTATYSTGSATVTGVASRYTFTVSPGDRLLRNSDNALIGTVLTVDSNTQITLTANALLTDTGVIIDVQKDAPAGVTYPAAGATGAMFTRVSSPVVSVAADAINIRTDTADFGTLYIPLGGLRRSTDAPYNIWVWVSADLITGPTGRCVVDLVRSDTLATIAGQSVTIADTESGKLIRVLFQSPDISAATAGVSLAVRLLNVHPMEVTVGPVGAAPAGGAITDTATPGGCDLAHEAGLWLDTQSLPVSYAVDLVDLEQVGGGAVSDAAIALGGTIRVDDRDLGVVSDQRVIEFTRDYLAPGEVSLTLGRKDKTLAEYLAGQSGLRVADVALALSRGLLTQAERLDATPTVQATTTTTTTPDTTNVRLVSSALRESFVNL